MNWITVSKRNEKGEETWRYQGKLLERGENHILLEAYFDRADTKIAGMLLARGDRFVETYYTDRWYNIFEIHNREDDQLRGWYCNIGCPAEIDGNILSYIDLALDLLVFPDGRQIVLDEDDFAELDISTDIRIKARMALAELQEKFHQKIQI
jgi:predicted RNA-binding protein associated with RNAse of E/G family